MHGASVPPRTEVGVAAWAREALGSATALPGVYRVGLALVEGGGRRLMFTASDRDSPRGPDWCHIDAYDDVPLNSALRARRPVLGAVAALHEHYPDFVERQRGAGAVAIAAIPIGAAGQTLGGYVLFYDEDQPFDAEQQRKLAELGSDLGLALRRAQRHEHRATPDFREEEAPPGLSSPHTKSAQIPLLSDRRVGSCVARWPTGASTRTPQTRLRCASRSW